MVDGVQYKQLDFWAPDTKFLTDAWNSGCYETGVPVCETEPSVGSLLMEDVETNCKSLRFRIIDFKERLYANKVRYDSKCSVKLLSVFPLGLNSVGTYLILYFGDPADDRKAYTKVWKSKKMKKEDLKGEAPGRWNEEEVVLDVDTLV
eukprot:TRINITY_DN531_c0_g1_i1.p1 TRINITY_DN531_c0_g1~~TRINITY_DN531_c0_g1_i1.p1  ORF type:complete len:148 (-),score=33.82 TRINITY_DN531_c0_g1_i1:757-1200(-)